MFNPSGSFKNRFGLAMANDFNEKFPGMVNDFTMHFSNDNGGHGDSWADAVYISGVGVGPQNNPLIRGRTIILFDFYLGRQYGNCGMAIISGQTVGHWVQRKGIANWLMKWQIKMMSDMGYTVAIGTTNCNQQIMDRVLAKHGWQEVNNLGFVNRRTKNAIKFWHREIEAPPPA